MQQNGKKTNTPKTAKPRTAAIPVTDEVTEEPVAPKKKTPKKAVSHIVTKDSEIDDTVRPYVAPSAPPMIDSTIFDEDVTEEPIAGYYHKSMTIDDTMLNREQATMRPRSKSASPRPSTLRLPSATIPIPKRGFRARRWKSGSKTASTIT